MPPTSCIVSCLAVSAALLTAGCSEDSPGPGQADSAPLVDGGRQDAAQQDSRPLDADQLDASPREGSVADAAGGDRGAGDATAPDSNTWDPGGRPYGQCIQDSDCYWGLPCAMAHPGGLCASCTMPSDCGDSFVYDCVDGLCKKLCRFDSDCPLGHACSEDSWCEPLPCGPQVPCPGPYVCGDDLTCTRPACAPDSSPCPPGMSCGQANTCVENYE